jgi:hypothetical protein
MGGRRTPQPARRQHGPGARAWIAALAAAVAVLVASPREASADAITAEVRGTVANGHGRLLFSFAREVGANVRHAGSVVVISFAQPVDIAVDRLASDLPGYVSVVRRDPDGMAVRLGLSRRVTINTMPAAEKLFVDLLPEGWRGMPPGLPQDVVDDLARRAREAEEKLRRMRSAETPKAADPVAVRVARLPTFTRFLFPVLDKIEVTASRAEQTVGLRFSAPLRFDISEVRAAAPEVVSAISAEIREAQTLVSLTLAGKADIRTFREDGTFALDVTPVAAEDESRPAAGVREEGGGSPAAPAPIRPVAAPAAAPAGPPAGSPAASPAAAPAPPPAKAEPPARTAAPDPAKGPVSARLVQHGEALRLLLAFPAQTSAAIFRRGDTAWLVFDSATPIDLTALTAQPDGAVSDVAIVRSGEGQALRLRLARPQSVSAAADGNTWIVAFGDSTLDPPAPLTVTPVLSGQGQATAAIAFDAVQRVHRLEEPDSTNGLLVATAFGPPRGVANRQEFVEFRLLPTAHGLALEAVADDVEVGLRTGQAVVRRPSGLAITTDTGTAFTSGDAPSALDAPLWAFDRQAEFAGRRDALMRNLGDAPEPRREAARLDLARFYLAQDRAAEAKGMLDLALSGGRASLATAGAHVLRGIANLMLDRPEAALKDLSAPNVGDQHDAELWRKVALARNRRFVEAHAGLQNVEFEKAGLPIELQRLALGEAARCALEVGDVAVATRRLNEIESLGVLPEQRAGIEVLLGRLAERLQRPNDALAAYRSATETRDEPTAAQARLRTIALRHALNQTNREASIAELESLTAGWRGDETEAEALSLLARLYFAEDRHRDGFNLMRVALAVHPRSRFTRKLQDEAAVAFDSIFLGERGEALSAVEALGLFYDFSHLTPAGRRGDEMIRRLAERLIAMDLLSKAGELLQHQVDHRLQGASRARIAARLAMVYLMDRKPDRALAALRTTRMNDLPNDLRRQRVLLEARALSDSERYDLALEIVAHLEGPEVDRLRADIHWAARHWSEAAETIERLYGNRWRETAPLDATERSDVLRAAVGYALAEDMLGLDRFREKYLDRFPDTPEKRMFAVVTAPLSARGEEFAQVAKAASAADTLTAFLRAVRTQYSEPGNAVSTAAPPPPGSG